MGLFTAYQQHQDGSGLGLSLAGTMLQQKISITRDQLSYGRMGDKRTELGLGVAANHRLTPTITLDSEAGINVRLKQDRQAFTGAIDYIGAYVDHAGDSPKVRPYIGLGMGLSQHASLRLSTGWEKTQYDDNALNAGLQYSYAW